MATHAPSTGAPTRATSIPVPPPAITRVLSRFDRDQLAGFIAVAIDLLDLADGDADREGDDADAEDDDPDTGVEDHPDGFDPEQDCEHDGSEHDDVTLRHPIYGVDQSAGPINFREALIEHQALEMGLVRTATGWRRP